MKLPSFAQCTVMAAGLAALALASQAALAELAPTSSNNLLVNGAFEKGTEGWTLSSYEKKGEMAMDETEKHANRPTLRLDNPAADDTFLKQKVAVKPNTRYRLAGFIKTKDVWTVKRDGKNGASLAVAGGFVTTQQVVKTKAWTRVTRDFATGGETEIELGPRLGFYSALTTGTAWFAELSLVELGKAPPRR